MTGPCTAPRHGTRGAYVVGCRCPEAREANRAYAAMRDRRVLQASYGAADPLSVPVARARVEIARLEAAGWSRRRIEAATGIKRDHLARIAGGTGRPVRRVLWATFTALRDLPDAPPAVGGQLVDAAGTWRRLEALIAIGWPKSHLARELGRGRALQLHRDKVTVRTAQAVADLYDRLSMQPGPSQRARDYARDRGYVPPLGWDDDQLDDPAGAPAPAPAAAPRRTDRFVDPVAVDEAIAGRLPALSLSRAERLDAVRRLHERGVPQKQIAARLRMHPRQVVRDLHDLDAAARCEGAA